MKNYQVTIGYRAVITVDVKAESEEDARMKALDLFKKKEREPFCNSKGFSLCDDRYAADGVVDMDETWNAIY